MVLSLEATRREARPEGARPEAPDPSPLSSVRYLYKLSEKCKDMTMGRGIRVEDAQGSLEEIQHALGRRQRRQIEVLRRFIASVAKHTSKDTSVGYGARVAAAKLDVSLPTVHAWVRAGVLTEAPGSRSTRIRLDTERVDALARGIAELRAKAPRLHLLRDVVSWMETRGLERRLSQPWVPGTTTGRASVDAKLDQLLREHPTPSS